MKIAVDAMGGDRAPRDVVEGVVQAVRELDSEVILVGDQSLVRPELDRVANGYRANRMILHHASQVIGMGESPATSVKQKKDSSIVVAAKLVKDGKAAAMVSMGNTGACMATALLEFGRLEGVSRPALAVPIPHPHGTTIVLDAGANVDCKASYLAQFAVMGEVYTETMHGIPRPRVGLLNVGEEEGKGGEIVNEAWELLSASRLNFIGNVEGGDITNGRVDVVVCDGFVGNIVLKFAEGMADAIVTMIRNGYRRSWLPARLGAWLSLPVFRHLKQVLDPAVYGGAPLLGVNGACIIGHGSSSPRAVRNAVAAAQRFVDLRINQQIRERLHLLHLPRHGGHG